MALHQVLMAVALAGSLQGADTRIHGVVEEYSGQRRPLRGAVVKLECGRNVQVVLTDDMGGFNFSSLQVGSCKLTAEKAGFVRMAYGAHGPGGLGIGVRLRGGQEVGPLRISLPRSSTILGRVRLISGEPAPNAKVALFQVTTGPTGVSVRATSKEALTDDRGDYRIGDLMPGRYLVAALGGFLSGNFPPQPSTADVDRALARLASEGPLRGAGAFQEGERASLTMSFARTFLGDGTLSGATAIEVGIEKTEEVSDVVLQARRLSALNGTVVGAVGAATRAKLSPVGFAPDALFSRSVQVSADGRFTFANVEPGHYLVRVEAKPPQGDPLIGVALVVVDGYGATEVQVAIGVGGAILGEIRTSAGQSPQAGNFRLIGVDGDAQGQSVSVATGPQPKLEARGLHSGHYRLVADNEWSIQIQGPSVNADGLIHVTPGSTQMIAIDLRRRTGRVSGVLTDRSAAAAGLWVITGSRPKAARLPDVDLMRIARSDISGSYEVNGLGDGEHFLCVVDSDARPDLQDPAVTADCLSRSVTFLIVTERAEVTLNLEVDRSRFGPGAL